MQAGEVLKHAAQLVELAGPEAAQHAKKATNFLDYANAVRDVVRAMPDDKLASIPWMQDFAKSLRRLRDTFTAEVAADPMSLYMPAHSVALAFHQSLAFIRYFRGGNRISKTESGCFENYAITTNQFPYRQTCALPASSFIVGSNFAQYGEAVFYKKYIEGEPGNPLSPVFPEGGKWLHHYNEKKHLITIACPGCANAGKARQCSHPKSTIQLFSDREGPTVLAGGQYALGQFDEHIDEEFFTEAIKRLETVPFASLIVTHTPLEGKGAWEHQRLTLLFEEGPPKNLVPGTKRPYVSLHTIDQLSAGLSSPELVLASMAVMTPAEAEARVYGRPSAHSRTGVFDSWTISEMYQEVARPSRGELFVAGKNGKKSKSKKSQAELLEEADSSTQLVFESSEDGPLRVWEPPTRYGQYIIGADVAQGLTGGDYSCASVLKLTRVGLDLNFRLVAQYHGHVNSIAYGEELMKLGLWYNEALLVPERRGPGDASIQRLKMLSCWFLFRDASDPAQATAAQDALFGLDTNVKTKGVLISMLQNTIKDKETEQRSIVIPCYSTLEELGHFGQEKTESGLSYRFRGEGGAHDDRVISLALAIYAARVYPEVYDIDLEAKARRARKSEELSDDDRQFWSDFRKEEKHQRNLKGDPFYD